MLFRKMREKRKEEAELVDRLNDHMETYRGECIMYMLVKGMSSQEMQEQDLSADHLLESALLEAIKATRELTEKAKEEKRCAIERE